MLKPFTTALLTVALAIMFASAVYAEEGRPQATVTAEQAQEALKKILPDVMVLSIEPAALSGLWEVAFTSRGDKGVVYLDPTRQFIVVGSIIGLDSGVNYTKRKFEAISTVDFASIPLENSVILGDPKAKFKVVVFDDPD